MGIETSIGMIQGHPRASGYGRVAGDYYCEPRWAVDALLKAERFNGLIWDPACGMGNIMLACREYGLDAFGSDIVQRGGADDLLDFLTSERTADNVITNPPFRLAQEFALHAMRRVTGKVVILRALTWLEGVRRRRELFAFGHLAQVWVLSPRVSMPPGGSAIEAKGGSKAFAWFVFRPDFFGEPTLGWLP
jgi:hypothetical protein